MPIFKNTVYQKINEGNIIVLQGTGRTALSPPGEFGGKEDELSPEEMFIGAINGCLMLTFFYFAKKADIEIAAYQSEAAGEVKKGRDGYAFSKVDVKAKVAVSDNQHIEKIQEISHLAEKYCLVSRSVNCPVRYETDVVGREEASSVSSGRAE